MIFRLLQLIYAYHANLPFISIHGLDEKNIKIAVKIREINFHKRRGGGKLKEAKAAGKGADGGPVFSWSFQSDFTNEMGNMIKPNESEATASMPYAS